MSNSYSPEYRKKAKFEIAGKIDYHEQLIAASKDKGSLLEEDRKVNSLSGRFSSYTPEAPSACSKTKTGSLNQKKIGSRPSFKTIRTFETKAKLTSSDVMASPLLHKPYSNAKSGINYWNSKS